MLSSYGTRKNTCCVMANHFSALHTPTPRNKRLYTLSTLALAIRLYCVRGTGNHGSWQEGGAARRFAHQDLPGCWPSLVRTDRKGAGPISHDHLPHQAQLRPVQCSIPAIICDKRTTTGFHARAASRKFNVIRRFMVGILLLAIDDVLCSTFSHYSTIDRA